MPLKIIKSDLLKVKADGIVKSTDINVSETFISDLEDSKKYKKIINITAPIYIDGKHNEYEQLRMYYQNIFNVSKTNNFKSITIPLISTSTFNFPKKEAYTIALEEINNYLIDNKLLVYLVINDNDSFSINKELSIDVQSYIDENYENDNHSLFETKKDFCGSILSNVDEGCEAEYSTLKEPRIKQLKTYNTNKISFELDESFSEAILRIIRERDLNEIEVYKKAGIDRKLFSKIRSNKHYVPSKKTAISLCIALELNLDETDELLQKAGLALSHSNLFDVIIEYFIKNNNYDLYDINVVLLENDQELIGC